MNVEELLKIIKKERLDRRFAYTIGPPNGKPIAFKELMGVMAECIYCDEEGVWRYYYISDRGGIKIGRYTYTESEACEKLLHRMRITKKYGW
jgi:hypothetical protein